ncbi:MAG: acyl-CoA dehydrogenase family protein [Bradymonadaceae bacterium]|nr:acyl-CoA dehydrogenase family protein [Lujinxingiaceae bacterium]
MSRQKPQGCAFLIRDAGEEAIFTPEQFTEDQRMFAQTADEFITREVFPKIEELEGGNFDEMVVLLKKAADIGLLMMDIPEQYGGLGVDKTTSMIVTEKTSRYSGFSASFGAHTGIGMLPLLYFGTQAQKEKYLPLLATGELLAAYALTEPGSGSDALAAKTTAVLSADGQHYVLNGTKMWITNAGFADLYTVFAQVDGDKFTAFLVEAALEGVSTGLEEKKMGLKGSSTRQVNLENVHVPRENLLGEIGKGHKIAFNILNIGRFKLGVGVLGGGKHTLGVAVKYAKERTQFGQPIAEFGAIRSKLADMATRLYTLESMCYRVAGYMDDSLETLDSAADDYAEQVMAAIEEFAVEDSVMKVFGSEVLDFVADEAVQIHGGYGFSAEYEVERIYRDSRINRIFEGTNEINRMLIPGMILKRTMKGQLNLFEMIQKVEAALAEPEKPTPPGQEDAPGLAFERFMTDQAKQLVVYCANQAIQKHMADLREQQEILIDLADMIIQLYAMDSTVSRTLQIIELRGFEACKGQRAATRVSLTTSSQAIRALGENLLANLASGDRLEAHLGALARLTFHPRVDVIGLRRTIADIVVDRERYPF